MVTGRPRGRAMSLIASLYRSTQRLLPVECVGVGGLVDVVGEGQVVVRTRGGRALGAKGAERAWWPRYS